MGVDEHERHPEGGGGADLGHLHEAIEEKKGLAWGITAASHRSHGGRRQHHGTAAQS
jgi:hypothetical protein